MEAKLLVSSGLFAEPRFRRLFKARHEEMRAMEIRTKTLTVAPIADPQQSFTVYKVQIRSKVRRADSGEWTLAKRYSEFARFRETLLKRVRAWEQALDAPARLDKQFTLISNALRKPITPNFPRKHMRCDTLAIVRERRAGLQDFLRKLLDAYADLSVYVYNRRASGASDATGNALSPSTAAARVETKTRVQVPVAATASSKNSAEAKHAQAHTQLEAIFLEIEAFLDIPAVQKEVERVQIAAILSLEDVDDDDHGCHAPLEQREAHPEDDSNDGSATDADPCGPVCCICLMGASESVAAAAHACAFATNKMVKLPCSHKFHEDCVISWFNASTTCPLCRSLASPTDSESSV